jgi:hypothetical protein
MPPRAATGCTVLRRPNGRFSLSLRLCVVLMQRRAMFRRIEDKIRRLSEQLRAAKDDQELTTILGELRDALHQHVERLRARAANYPIVLERRSYPPTETSSRSGSSHESRGG